MSADSSGLGKPDGGSSPGEMSSSTPEAGGVTEGKVDNACNSQAHSTTHSTQSQTNHTPIPAHTQSTDGTHQDCASCHGDKGAKVGEQKDSLTSVIEEVSNSEQKCIEQTSHLERIYVNPSVNNEDSESSTESNDQSNKLRLKAKEENQDKTFVIIYRRSENDPGDQSDEAVQLVTEVNHDKNQGVTSDTTRRPKGNEQKDNDTGAVPRVRGVKLEQNIGCKVTDIDKRTSKKENGIDDRAMQRVEDGKHDQKYEMKDTEKRPSRNNINDGAMQRIEDRKHDGNNEFKDSEKRPSGNDIDDEAMQRVEDRKLEQKYGNKDTEERPSGNEKNNDNRTKPSVKNEDNGDNDIEKRLIKYEKNDKSDWTTKDLKEEHSDINRKVNQTEKESRENEKKDHPDKATQSASVKKCQRSEKSLEDNGSKQSQDKLSGNTNNDGEWTEGKKEKDKTRPTGLSGDPDMNPSNVNTDGTDSTVSWKDDNGTMQGAVMLATDNSRDKSMMKNEGLGQIAVTATDQESQTKFDKLKKELGETNKGTLEDKGNDQKDGTNSISQIGDLKLSDNTASVLGYPCRNLDESDGGTKEIKGKGALANTTPKTQPSDRRDENHAYHQDEAGAVSSKPSHEALSFSQSQDDNTLLDKQIDEFIDSISTDINENREEWKKSTKEKMSFFLTKVMDGTLSQRSFDSCVTNSMPVKNFDSDIHITEKQTEEAPGARRRQGAEGGPAATPHNLQNDPRKRMTKQHEELQYIDEEENPQEHLRQTDSSLKESLQKVDAKSYYGNKTSRAPDPPTGGTSLSKSCLPAISADGNSRSSSIKEKPGDLLKVAEEKSLGKKTSNAPDPPTGGTPLSKLCLPRISMTGRSIDCSSSTSQIDMDCKKNAEGVKTESLRSSTAGSSKRPSSEDYQEMKNENTIPPDNPSGMPFVESHFASGTDTELSHKEDKKEVRKHDYSFVVEADTRLKEEEWELQVECSPTEYLKLLVIFSNKTLKIKAKEKFRSFKIILNEGHSMHLEKASMCIKPAGHTKLDGLFIDDVLSACESLFPLVHLKKMVMDPSTSFEEINTFCFSFHDACKKKQVQLLHKKGSDEVWVAIEHEILDFGNEVIKDLIGNNLATECPLEQKNHKLIAYFVQSAALKDKDLRLFSLLNMLKKNKYLAEKYEGMNVSEKEKWVVISGHKEIHEDLFERVRKQSWSVPSSLKELLNNHEVVEFIFQNFQAKHPNEPMIWMVAEQSGKSFLEAYALKSSSINVFETVLHCFKEMRFEYACLQKDAFLLPILKGDKFRGKIGIQDTENYVKITGTVDVFEEYIDLLKKESDRLKRPVFKTVDVNSTNILRFCETYHQDSFREWKKIVDIGSIVRDGKCCFTIKGYPKNQEIVEEIENELKKLLTSIVVKEVVSKEELINVDLSRNQELRKKRCEIEREWSVDTVFEGVPGQDWSVEDGFEWHFQNGQYFTILTLKSALPVETDVVLHPCPKANIKVGTHQTDTDDNSNRDWHCLKFEVEHKDNGKAKDTLRESLKTTLLTKVKGKFQNIVFPLDQKTVERIGWSITHYLKQILYAVHEGCRSEPWSIYFLCATKDEFEACVKILKKHFEDSKSSMSSLKIRTFPIQENLTPAITIEIKQGSLVETQADVIVNTTDKSLRRLQNGQISKSILFAAGDELSKECVKKYSKGVDYSEVAVTPSFQLKLCKKIYHGGIPSYNGTLEPLKKFVWNCLLQATKDKMKTIAFPAIGTGNLMYPIESVAEAMMSTVEKFRDEQSTTLISVFFVIFDTGTLQKFRERNSSKQAASGTETPSMRITVIGSSDGAENASLCLRAFINELKKKKEDVNVTKPAEFMQPPTLEGNEAQGKSKEIVDDQRTILSETLHKRENISDDGIPLGLILVKKALETDSSLDVEECRRHLSEFKYKNIIFPFGNGCQALVKFETKEDTDRVLKNFKSASFKIEKLPHQAVNNIKAKLCREIVNYLIASDIQEEEVENGTGAHLDKNEWIITGTLLEIKQAEEFLRKKICENAESKGQNSNTCLPKRLPETSAVDASAKKTLHCSISDYEAVRFYFKDVISKLHSKPDLDESRYVVSGNLEAINEFSHTLNSLFKRTLTNIGQDYLKLATKSKSVFCYFAEKERTLIMYAKSEELLKSVEELFKSIVRKVEHRHEVLDEENQNLPHKTYPSTTDNKDAQSDEDYEIEADDFNTVCHFYKEFTTDLKKNYDESKVHLTGPKDKVENLKIALQEIKRKFHTVEIERDGREQSKIYDIYVQMMKVEHSVHTRVIMRGSNIAVLFTGKEEKKVADLKSWFEGELKYKTKTSGNKIATYQTKSSLYENCLIFEQKQIKVYAIEKDILEISTAAIVCPYPIHVGQYIRKKLGVESGIADYIGQWSLDEIKAIPVDTSSSKLTLLHTSLPYWTKYVQRENPSDDCIQDIQSIFQKCLSAGEIFKTLSIPVFFSDDLCQLPNMVWCTAVERALRNYSKSRNELHEMNIYIVDKTREKIQLLKNFFMDGINWEFVSNDTFSVFYFGSSFQVHVKKADIFGAKADALAVPQDPEMKNERFIAKQLLKLEDSNYKSGLKSLKSCKHPTITVAPSQLCFSKVIHYVSPNWTNKKKKREALLQDHYLSMKTLLDTASSQCTSVVIPFSGGQNTTDETRKEIAKSTAAAVVDWFEENSKKLNILETIYLENNDTKNIKTLIECFERKIHISCFVMRSQLSSAV